MRIIEQTSELNNQSDLSMRGSAIEKLSKNIRMYRIVSIGLLAMKFCSNRLAAKLSNIREAEV
jgi:hypothetical protein